MKFTSAKADAPPEVEGHREATTPEVEVGTPGVPRIEGGATRRFGWRLPDRARVARWAVVLVVALQVLWVALFVPPGLGLVLAAFAVAVSALVVVPWLVVAAATALLERER